ncbi:MAG: reverse gyrase [Zestosphaera sp.]
MTIEAVFRGLCPNCGGDVESNRLAKGLPCSSCLSSKRELELMRDGYLRKLKIIEEKVKEVDEVFLKVVNSRMWGLQRLWARRFFNNESFAMIAPTGSGKTTMQIMLALYAAREGRRSLILVPTSLLASQVHSKTLSIRDKLGLSDVRVVAYHSLMTEKNKKEAIMEVSEASIIITTPASLMKKPELRQPVSIAFIDDVDSFLRRSKSVEIVLRMLGVAGEDEELANKVQELESKARKLALESPEEARRVLDEAHKLRTSLQERIKGIIVVSGATQTARRTKRIKMLNTLYGFTVGGKTEIGRNITDFYVRPRNETIEELVAEIIKKAGGGGLIYVPMDKGAEYVKRLTDFLKGRGFRVEAYLGSRKRVFNKFVEGELDALVGIASYRSPLTRGIDLPERVRYAVFAGVPKFRLRISVEDFQPSRWLILLNEIRDAVYSKYPEEFDKILGGLIKIRTASRETLELVREALKNGRELSDYQEFVRRVAEESLRFMNKVLKDPEVINKLKESKTITFGGREGEYFFVIPDAISYIQASGRTSRLYVGGLTKGLSVLVVDEEKAFNALLRDLKWLLETVEFVEYDEKLVSRVLKEVDRDRVRVRQALEGKLRVRGRELMKTTLFVVESPNKARTIARLFGRPTKRVISGLQTYEVLTENRLMIITATGGHILDLVTDEGRFGVLVKGSLFRPIYKPIRRCVKCGRDVPEDEVKCPSCGSEVFVESKPVIEVLRKLASQVDEILVGTDPDAEGEKIAWDITLLLKPLNNNIYRVKFHEVTRRGLTEALNNLTSVSESMVHAQIVRRIEDRWIGFSLSPVLWRKFNLNFLSAGRVQTPVLGWIVDRTNKHKIKAELVTLKLEGVDAPLIFKAPKGFADAVRKAGKVILTDVRRSLQEIYPPPPYTTDTMLSEATRVLKVSASKVMESAQRLFEAGLITYHRTDSTTVSSLGVSIAKDYIQRVFGEEFFQGRKWEREGAHECIRPTRPLDSKQIKALRAAGVISFAVLLRPDDYRLYDLIFKRFIASQMSPSKVEKTSFKLVFNEFVKEFTFVTKVVEEGFSKLNKYFNVVSLGNLRDGEYVVLEVSSRAVPEHPLYTYSDLVELMKDRGIGRPSTYAKILDILRRRGYAIEVGKGKLVATSRGREVFKFLNEKFSDLINEERTRKLQEKIDLIEAGRESPESVLREFYREIKNIRAYRATKLISSVKSNN